MLAREGIRGLKVTSQGVNIRDDPHVFPLPVISSVRKVRNGPQKFIGHCDIFGSYHFSPPIRV